MPNPHRGEATFQIDGKEHLVIIDYNAMAEIQEDTGVSLMDRAAAEKKSFSFLRSALARGLSHHGARYTPAQAGDLIGSHMEDLAEIGQAIGRAISLFLVGPNPPKETEASDDDRPTKAATTESQATT
jgi:hypothetical protein